MKWEYAGTATGYVYEKLDTSEVGIPVITEEYSFKLEDTEVFEMQVYDVIVVDTKECEVLHRQKVIAEDEKTAMLELNVTEEIKKLQKKGRVKFIFNQLGGFNRYTRKVRIKEEDE